MTNEEKAREIKYNSCAADCGTLISLITAALDERDALHNLDTAHGRSRIAALEKITSLESKLAKAVKALEYYVRVSPEHGAGALDVYGKRARATLAEIKGDV